MPSSAKPSPAAAIGTLISIIFLVLVAVYQVQPPAAVPANASPGEFSAMRAMEQLKVIAQKPHPTGSPENARVREYVMGELRALGLDPQVQTATTARYEPKWKGPAVAATVKNVVARLKGTANTKAVMLAAHYDSVPSGPGASDDGSGTVTLLETARALQAGPPLHNDLIFLITDGEELGLLGAQAFVDEHPWAKDIGLVLNFEARGACGPSFMFETSRHNGWLIREFARAVPHAVTSSFAYEAYKHIPNDTDSTVFKRAGLAGLNFAYIGCWPRYHTLRDDVEHISAASLQHDGSYALALARRFGNLDLTHTAAPDAIYFSLLGITVHYPEAWATPAMVLAILLFAGVTLLGFRRRHLTWGGIATSLAGWLGGTAVAAALAHFAWLLLRGTGFANLLPDGTSYNGDLYAYGFIALTVAILSGLYAVLGRRILLGDLAIGTFTWWAVLTVLTGLFLKGASYLFVWPLLASLIALAYAFTGSRGDEGMAALPPAVRKGPAFPAQHAQIKDNHSAFSLRRPSQSHRCSAQQVAEPQEFLPDATLPSRGRTAFVWMLPAIVGILVFAVLPYLLVMLVSTTAVAVVVIVTALLVGLLVPHVCVMTAHKHWLLPSAALGASLALLVTAIARRGYDTGHPRADSVLYALDADTGKAVWASGDKTPDAWTSQFLGAGARPGDLVRFSFLLRKVSEADAPSILVPVPEAVVTDDLTIGAVRMIRLQISSLRRAGVIWMTVKSARVLEAEINGKRIPVPPETPADQAEHWSLVYVAVPQDGLMLTLKVSASQTPVLTVADQTQGLPDLAGRDGRRFRPRPDDIMPSPRWDWLDSSLLVGKPFRLDANAPMHHR